MNKLIIKKAQGKFRNSKLYQDNIRPKNLSKVLKNQNIQQVKVKIMTIAIIPSYNKKTTGN